MTRHKVIYGPQGPFYYTVMNLLKVMREHIFASLLLLTGCATYHQKECYNPIRIEAEHAKDVDSLVRPNVEHALVSIGYERHWNDMWVNQANNDLIKFRKYELDPFALHIAFWDDPGTDSSCNIKAATIKNKIEEGLLANKVHATVQEMIPND